MTEPTTFERLQRVQSVDVDAGTFGMTLATEGEAVDGHILAIEGGTVPDRMPMLVSHWNDPTRSLGSIVRARKHLSESPRRLSAMGEVETDGEGVSAEIRRDVLHMIARGHITAVSIRWNPDPKHSIPRTELPNDHPHYVDRDKEPFNSPKRYGMLFKRWTAQEGSVVAVGSDPKALIGRAGETRGEVSSFWRALSEHTDPPAPRKLPEPPTEAMLAAFAAQIREFAGKGVTLDALRAVLDGEQKQPTAEEHLSQLLARIDAFDLRIGALEGRVTGAPAAHLTTIDTIRSVLEGIRQDRTEALGRARAELERMKGRVTQ